MEEFLYLKLIIGVGAFAVIWLTLLFIGMVRSYYRHEFAINRKFNMTFCACIIGVGSWMASFAFPMFRIVEVTNIDDVYRTTLIAGPIIAAICIGIAWLVGYLLVNEINVSFKIKLNRR